MPLRNGPHGYGVATKILHWLTVGAIAAQFTVGYLMSDDGDVRDAECDPAGEDRTGGDTSDAEEERFDRVEEACEQQQDARDEAADNPVATAYDDLWSGDITGGLGLPEWHVLLGVLILLLAVARLTWRALTPLPPWSDALTPGQQRFVALTEKALLALLFAVPLTGLAMALGGDDDLLPLHIAAHIGFFAALAAHLSMTLRPRILPRMLPGGRP